jgi:hypothetical protein
MMAITALALAATLAIVTQDQSALRAAPRDSAQQQAALWQGDVLEVRGQRMDHLQVYDHRRERAGYVRASQVRTTSLQAAEAPELLSVMRFVRDTPGAEALGVGYAAAYLKAVPAGDITAEPFDVLGSLADRLARRASARQGKGNDATLAAHLEVVASYGVTLNSHERDGSMQICYDGEAFRRVLAMPTASAPQRARAALGLTRHECVDPQLRPHERFQVDQWRADVLERVDLSQLPETLKNRMQLRRAGVWAALAHAHARRLEAGADGLAASSTAAVQAAARRSVDALAAVNKAELTDDDQLDYTEAALRASASRWAAEPAVAAAAGAARPGRLAVLTQPGQPGETCVLLVDPAKPPEQAAKAPLMRRCTYGAVWAASASASPDGRALALAVQPLDTWRELWVFRRGEQGWTVDVLPPASSTATGPDLGYSEFAGWVPGGERLLVARESRVDGRFKRSFEVLLLSDLSTDKQASQPQYLQLFSRWQDPAWKRQSLSLR